jgi:6-pyruvoyltetrahydropterin/6-carboxytetrahydropterin synthase
MPLTKVTKTFKFESAHRLPWHQGDCKNLHGHSYRLEVELEGEPDERGMLIDFADIKRIIKPLVNMLDHATLIAADDYVLIEAMSLLNSKHYILPFDTTSENLCTYVIEYLYQNGAELIGKHRIQYIRVRVQETESCYAELRQSVEAIRKQHQNAIATNH